MALPTMRHQQCGVYPGWLTSPRPCPPPCPPGVLPLQAERCCGCCGHDARRCGCWGGRHRGGYLGIGQARRRAQASDAAEAAPAEPCGEPGASRRRAGSPAWQGQREGQGQWRQLGGRAGSVVCGNLSSHHRTGHRAPVRPRRARRVGRRGSRGAHTARSARCDGERVSGLRCVSCPAETFSSQFMAPLL